jgi:two-component system, chemotaxis family, chemotaxis protein CheY
MTTCLVVDDSDVIRRVVTHMLHALGLRSEEATGPLEALAKCDVDMPDYILLDWHMPGLNVVDFLTQLRARPNGACVKIIYSTSEHDPVDIARAMTAGANDYVVKPFDRATLAQKLGVFSAV